MSRDIMTSGGRIEYFDEVQQASYALGKAMMITLMMMMMMIMMMTTLSSLP